MSRQVDQSPGAALQVQEGKGTPVSHDHQELRRASQLTLSFLALYGALLSVMEVCVRLNFPDNSCRDMKRAIVFVRKTITPRSGE